MIKISDLYITQDGIRIMSRIRDMIQFSKSGGLFDLGHIKQFHKEDAVVDLIKLSRFPDNKIYLHDGHHRCVSKFLAGIDHLDESEYMIKDWENYDAYRLPNLKVGWYTPFDLHTEIRTSDFFKFKEEVDQLPEDHREAFIMQNKHRYAKPRTMHTVADLAHQIGQRL